jgi:tripeptidyl-peptidase-1
MLPKSLILLAIALASSAASVVHDRRAAPPEGFVRLGAAPADKMLTFRINLASSDLAGLESKLMSAATPGSDTFRQWLSKEEVWILHPTMSTIALMSVPH